jgi:hypothetical protein
MKIITLTQFDQIQIFATAQALSCAKDGLFLTRPANIRHTALVWLDKVNVKVSPKAKWATLHKEFAETFAQIIQKK